MLMEAVTETWGTRSIRQTFAAEDVPVVLVMPIFEQSEDLVLGTTWHTKLERMMYLAP